MYLNNGTGCFIIEPDETLLATPNIKLRVIVPLLLLLLALASQGIVKLSN